jgi:hypothetical protein
MGMAAIKVKFSECRITIIRSPQSVAPMSKILLILTAFASVTLGNTSARAESPEQYVRAKYGKHDLLLAEKNRHNWSR